MKQLFAYILIFLMLSACTERDRYATMCNGLDSINMVNRNGQPFTTADVQPYVDYFDCYGNSNDQMLAHYLLGRAYYEHGEAPMALQCYHDALDCVDTTAADCDYKQLSRVYGQMADIFYYQGLYRKNLLYNQIAEKHAWKGKDTLLALMSYEQNIHAYHMLGIADSVIYICQHVSELYRKYGYNDFAAIALAGGMRTLINNKEYATVKNYIDIYEKESGCFDSDGNIESGREIYYNIKGHYYLGIGNLDSAEYWFRKELRDGKDFNNQQAGAKGLAELYQKLHRSDSVAKHSLYAYAMSDSAYAQRTTKEVERIQALYDYSRHQRQADMALIKASRIENMVWICVGIILLLIFTGYVVNERVSRRRKELERKYLQRLEIIRQARRDIELLRENQSDYAKLIAEKEKVIYEQKDYLKTLPVETLLYKHFSIKGQEPTAEEWQQIERQVLELYPQFRQFMEEHVGLLNDKEYKTCILIRAGFKPKSISNMLNVGPSYISNIRTEMLQKLFSMEGTPKNFDESIKKMN